METGLSENLFAQMLKILIKGLIPVNLLISKDPVLLDLQVCFFYKCFFWGQPIKLVQVASTSELHEY